MKKNNAILLGAILLFALLCVLLVKYQEYAEEQRWKSLVEKPVIYLYPEEETTVTVRLDYDGTLTTTYPAYGEGWRVTARPDGTLTDPETGREYYCLF